MRTLAAALLAGLAVSGCSKPVDLKNVLRVDGVTGGYHDAGIVDGRNKVIPSVTFRLSKSTGDSIRPLSLNVVFKKLPPKGAVPPPGAAAEEEWDEVFLQSVSFDGNQTAPLTVRPTAGYTGDPPQSRADILKHSQFQDVRAHIFAKHSSSQWVEIAQYDIPR